MSMLTKVAASVVRGIDKMNGSMGWVIITFIILMTFVMDYEVFRRYVLNSPTSYSLEVCQIVQVLLPMITVAYVLKEGGHVIVGVLVDRLQSKMSGWVNLLNSIIGVICSGIMVWLLWAVFESAMIMNERTPAIEAPMCIIRLVMVIGFCLFGLQFIVHGYKYYRQARGKDG